MTTSNEIRASFVAALRAQAGVPRFYSWLPAHRRRWMYLDPETLLMTRAFTRRGLARMVARGRRS